MKAVKATVYSKHILYIAQQENNKSYDEQVPYYEYCNIPRQVFVCARQPQYTQHFTDEIAESRWEICEGCKSFTLSRETMRLGRERKKAEKWVNRHFFQKEITIDPTSLKFKIF